MKYISKIKCFRSKSWEKKLYWPRCWQRCFVGYKIDNNIDKINMIRSSSWQRNGETSKFWWTGK
jgi:hypothetical protein